MDVALRGAAREGKPFWTPFVSFINYDAKGQRTLIRYANGATTTYDYDRATFRLTHLRTTRKARDADFAAEIFNTPETLQDLRYTYDPVGNITRIEDAALKTVFHANHRVDAVSDYTFDPLYRLLDATGRKNAGQSAFSFMPKDGDYRDFPFVGAARRNDLQAIRRYVERYDYDPVGNFRTMAHHSEGGNWERRYAYEEASLIEPGKVSNRLSRTSVDEGSSTLGERYRHDAHGNMTRMPHLPRMRWDFHDQLRVTTRQVLNEGTPEETWYIYDSSGQRVRKISTRRDHARKNERLYLGDFEVFRAFGAAGAVELERETLHVMDDKQRIALVETLTVDEGAAAVIPDPAQRYQLANHLGSGCLELGDGGELISFEEYSPYGNSTFQAGRNATEMSLKRYRYTGKERDEENGFTYHRARYYAPWLGRWTACDPIGIGDGTNVYQYVSANPIRLVDDRGLEGGSPEQRKVIPHRFTGKESIGELHKFARAHGYDFSGKPHWTGKAWDVGTLTPIDEKSGSPAEGGSAKGEPGGGGKDASGYQQPGAEKKEGVGGTGKEKGAAGTPLTELDYAVLLASLLSPLGSGEGKRDSTSGGVPGGRGPKSFASTLGQLAYIAVNIVFTFFGDFVESGLKKAWTAVKGAASAVKAFVKETAIDFAFSFFGAGGPGGLRSGAGRALGKASAAGRTQLARMGLEDVELAGASYNSGRKQLEAAGFKHTETTSTGRQVFVNEETGARVTYDSGKALTSQQKPHWTIQDRAGQFYDRSGRAVQGASPPMGGRHIKGR